MSQKRGLLTESPGGNIVGNVKTLEMEISFELQGNPDFGRVPDLPPLLIVCRGIEIGGAWKRVIKEGDNQGQEMYSLSIDGPEFPAPLNFGAFPNGDAGQFDVVWSRPKKPKLPVMGRAASAPATASNDNDPPPPTAEDAR